MLTQQRLAAGETRMYIHKWHGTRHNGAGSRRWESKEEQGTTARHHTSEMVGGQAGVRPTNVLGKMTWTNPRGGKKAVSNSRADGHRDWIAAETEGQHGQRRGGTKT